MKIIQLKIINFNIYIYIDHKFIITINLHTNTLLMSSGEYLFYFHSFCTSFLAGDNRKTEEEPMTKATTTYTCASYSDHIPLALRIYLGG